MASKSLMAFLGATLVSLSATPVHAVNFPFEDIQLNQSDIGNFSAIQFGNPYQAAFPFGGFGGRNAPECRAFPGTKEWPTEAEWARLNATLDGALLHPKPAAAACYLGGSGVKSTYNRATCQFLTRLATFTHYWLDDPLDVLTQWPQGNTCLLGATERRAGAGTGATGAGIVGNCTQGGYPAYVVNATTVKHVQAAVNFARNKHLRVVIKNTGHDFGGRSVGAGALSIWVHNLKAFEFVPQYTLGLYSGMAVKYGAGLESWELFNQMGKHNISVLSPGGGTVGALGGWFSHGGHGTLTSKLGLGSDSALSIEVVTADGRLVTADPFQNTDLFFALRGGGPSTYGVMTSVVMKAFPPINMTGSSVNINLVTGPATGVGASPFGGFPPLPANGSNPFGFPPLNGSNPFRFPPVNGSNPFGFPPLNGTNPFGFPPINGSNPFGNFTFPNFTFPFPFPPQNGTARGNGTRSPFGGFGGFGGFPQPGTTHSPDTFWKAVSTYYRFGRKVLAAGGYCFGYIYPQGNGGFSFTSSQSLPDIAPEAAQKLMQPLYDELAALGIQGLSNPLPRFAAIYGSGHREGGGDGPVQTRYRSRLFPKENWDDDDKWNATMLAIRHSLESVSASHRDRFYFHGIMYSPTKEVAGWPGRDSAVNPAWRTAHLHASLMDTQPLGLTAAQAQAHDDRAKELLDMWRAVTPGSGAYLNEGDPAEPNWQQSFYGGGARYARLLAIKRRHDPWGLFWAPTTVGSEAWEVRSVDGYPGSQNGPLCRVADPDYGGGNDSGAGDDDDDAGDDDDN